MSTAPVLSIKITYPNQVLEPSYFDLQFLGTSIFGSGTYDAWCVDADVSIQVYGPSGGVYSTTLKAGLYSSYELGAIAGAFPTIENPQYLDEANWLLNQHFTVGANAYTINEVQAALWTLLGDADQVATQLPGTDSARVNTLVQLALQHDGFAPDITDNDPNNDEIGLLLNPWVDSNGNNLRDPGETAQQPLIVMVKSAALGDRVWHDANGDGIQNSAGDGTYTEQGIAGAVVHLVRDRDGDGAFTSPGEVLATTTTDANGNYVFKSLTPGLDYQVQFFLPAGFDAASPRQQGSNIAADSDAAVSNVVVLSAGEWNKTIDAGYYKHVAVGDFVWHDQDADGIQDSGETGIGGVRLTLTGTTGSGQVVVRSTITAADGSYLFDALPPGTYQVAVDASNFGPTGALSAYQASPIGQGMDPALDSNASPTGTTPLTLMSGAQDRNLDFGYFKATAALGDRVWEDKDADGVQDAGENGIAGATVRLYTCVDGAPGTLVATTTTNANGNYAFTGLTPGNYIVAFETPASYQLSTANVGADSSDSDAGMGGLTGCYTLASGETNTTVDAGFWRPAAIGDRVWLDTNANGQQDAGEAGVANVTVELYACVGGAPAGAALATTTTNSNGDYAFLGLMPGQYIVKLITPNGYSLSPVDVGADGTDSDAGTGGFTGCYTLASGETNTTVDAGLYQGAAIGDRVWEDRNANGQQDAGENGIAGATVRLYTCVNNAPGVLIAQTTTDANGNYAFTNLMPGDYIVAFETPTGYQLSTANVGANDATDSDAGTSGFTGCYTLASGETNTTVDAGFWHPAAIGDRVWLDTNANGQQDAGEAGVAGVAVELYTCVNNQPGVLVASTSTDTSGNYGFTGLKPGDYLVKFITPAGYSLSPINVGGDGTDSDAGLGGFTACYNLESGETDNSVDAGIFRQAPGITIVKDASQVIVSPNTPVTFTYSVKNTGGVALSNIVVTDDNATPEFAEDDFNPTAVLGANGKNIGDLDADGLLDTNEIWKYSASVIPVVQMTITPAAGGPTYDAGMLSYETLANGDIRVYYRQDNNFNDNTYGTGSDIGWTSQGKTHKFGDLTGSDKAGFEVRASDGTVLFKFYQDYITASTTNIDGYTAYSGYQSLGFSGGDGSLVSGGTLNAQAATLLKDFDSTLELNLNQAGIANNGIAYTSMTVNSPVGDAGWDVVNGYYFTISAAAFTGGKTFGGVTIFDQHNSPAKTGGSNTYVPTIVVGASVNTAVVTGTDGSTTVTASDDATVQVVPGPLGALGDRVWLDLDADGVQDAGEAGIAGVKLTLLGDFDQNGTIDYTATTTTGANGLYSFTGLPAGEYSVIVDTTTLPAKLVQTYDLDGLDTPNEALRELAAGQTRTDFDFGYVPTAPGFALVKTADKTSAAFGEAITYTYEVSNTGSQALANVVLRDDNATPGDASDDFLPSYLSGDDGDGLLETGEVWRGGVEIHGDGDAADRTLGDAEWTDDRRGLALVADAGQRRHPRHLPAEHRRQ